MTFMRIWRSDFTIFATKKIDEGGTGFGHEFGLDLISS